jgi:hypothetical protein
MTKRLIGHDRREDATVGSHARRKGGDDLLCCPFAQAGLGIGRQIAADEHAKTRDRETHIRAAKKARRVRVAEEAARGVAVGAAAERDKIPCRVRVASRPRRYALLSRASSLTHRRRRTKARLSSTTAYSGPAAGFADTR